MGAQMILYFPDVAVKRSFSGIGVGTTHKLEQYDLYPNILKKLIWENKTDAETDWQRRKRAYFGGDEVLVPVIADNQLYSFFFYTW